MQCSCGGSTKTAWYRKTTKGVVEHAYQEICTACGRADKVRPFIFRGNHGKPTKDRHERPDSV